jgi:TonB-dependent SusC/RagA subfamily outer membrane receptor
MSSGSDTINPVVNQILLTGNVTISHNPAIPSKIIINGKEIIISKLTLEGFDTAKIVSAELYFDTTTGFDTAKVVSGVLHAAGNKMDSSNKPLVLIDGVKQARNSTDEILKSIDPLMIQSMNVLKGEAAIAKYGEEARNGVIEIITKKNTANEIKEVTVSEKRLDGADNKIFTKVETDPSFPGGAAKWKQYLKVALNANIPSQKGAPVGIYTVIVQFVVKKDSFITDVKALTNHGFGMEEEAIRLISKGPRWIPAMQNGKQVTSYWKQPVTFYVTPSTLQSTPPVSKNLTLTPYDTSGIPWSNTKAIIVIDGKVQEGMTTYNINEKIKPADIESMNILKDASAVYKYGDKGKNGVIEIITKAAKKNL